jgi:hypothetical protein
MANKYVHLSLEYVDGTIDVSVILSLMPYGARRNYGGSVVVVSDPCRVAIFAVPRFLLRMGTVMGWEGIVPICAELDL